MNETAQFILGAVLFTVLLNWLARDGSESPSLAAFDGTINTTARNPGL